MSVMHLPELKTRLHKNDDEVPTRPQDDSPRQSDFWDWIEGFLSAPPLDAHQ